jgi:uncharacterized protein
MSKRHHSDALLLEQDLLNLKNRHSARKVWKQEEHGELAGHMVKTAHGLIKAVHNLLPPEHQDPDLFADRSARGRRMAYRGRNEKRTRGTVGNLHPGEENRNHVRRALEVRNLKGNKGSLVNVEGSPILYNVPYRVQDSFGEFTETMRPGVAAHLIEAADCRFLYGHGGVPMARTKSGTMRLRDTRDALTFEAQVDIRQKIANDLVIAIERGDVSQMSVSFVVETDHWDSDYSTRSVTRFRELLDVSAVCYPASPATSISLAGAGMGGRV